MGDHPVSADGTNSPDPAMRMKLLLERDVMLTSGVIQTKSGNQTAGTPSHLAMLEW